MESCPLPSLSVLLPSSPHLPTLPIQAPPRQLGLSSWKSYNPIPRHITSRGLPEATTIFSRHGLLAGAGKKRKKNDDEIWTSITHPASRPRAHEQTDRHVAYCPNGWDAR